VFGLASGNVQAFAW